MAECANLQIIFSYLPFSQLSFELQLYVIGWLKMGVTPYRLATVGLGEKNPGAANKKPDGSGNPEGRKKNRRVDIVFAETFSAIKQ